MCKKLILRLKNNKKNFQNQNGRQNEKRHI